MVFALLRVHPNAPMCAGDLSGFFTMAKCRPAGTSTVLFGEFLYDHEGVTVSSPVKTRSHQLGCLRLSRVLFSGVYAACGCIVALREGDLIKEKPAHDHDMSGRLNAGSLHPWWR